MVSWFICFIGASAAADAPKVHLVHRESRQEENLAAEADWEDQLWPSRVVTLVSTAVASTDVTVGQGMAATVAAIILTITDSAV